MQVHPGPEVDARPVDAEVSVVERPEASQRREVGSIEDVVMEPPMCDELPCGHFSLFPCRAIRCGLCTTIYRCDVRTSESRTSLLVGYPYHHPATRLPECHRVGVSARGVYYRSRYSS